MPAYIDGNGNIVQQRPAESEMTDSARMEGRELLLRADQERRDIEAQPSQDSGGFQFFGFPDFKWRSVIGVIVALQLAMYIVSLWVVTPRGGISPTGGSMFKIGSSNSAAEMCAIRDSFPKHLIELRRWFVPIFLHNSPFHILMNLFFECSTGPRIEEQDSSLSFAMLFMGAGLMGNLLSDSFGINGVGGSTSCYGLIGMDFAVWYQKWPGLDQEQRDAVKSGMMQTCGMLLLWEFIFWKEIDHFGHLGGFIGGFLILLGRTDWRCIVAFALAVATCITVICIKPLFDEMYNGTPWRQTCDSIWMWYQ